MNNFGHSRNGSLQSSVLYSRLVVISSLSVLTVNLATGQEIRTDEEAVHRAVSFVRAIGARDASVNGRAGMINRPGTTYRIWNVDLDNGSVSVSINPQSGVVTGYSDFKVSDLVTNRTRKHDNLVLREDGLVWARAEGVLRAAGLDKLSMVRKGVTYNSPPVGRWKSAFDGFTVVTRFEEPVQGWEGHLNSATLTFDAVTGGLMLLSGSDQWRFDPPGRVMERGEALQAMQGVFSQCLANARLRGARGQTDAWTWPGNDAVLDKLRLEVLKGGNSAYGFTEGARLAEEHRARVCWLYEDSEVSLAIDAESGAPIALTVKKGSPSYSEKLSGNSQVSVLREPELESAQDSGKSPVSLDVRSPGARKASAADLLVAWGFAGACLVVLTAVVVHYARPGRFKGHPRP